MKANHKERFINLKTGKGSVVVKVGIGQFIFGRHKAEEELDIDGATIYRWINKFASEQFDNMISLDVSSQYTIVTICKWEEYQSDKDTECTTNEQPLNNQCTTIEQPMSTNKNDNNDNNDKNKLNYTPTEEINFKSNKFIKPSLFEVQKQILEKGYNVDAEAFIAYYESNGWKVGNNKMKDWKSALVTWQKRSLPVKTEKPKSNSGRLSLMEIQKVYEDLKQ